MRKGKEKKSMMKTNLPSLAFVALAADTPTAIKGLSSHTTASGQPTRPQSPTTMAQSSSGFGPKSAGHYPDSIWDLPRSKPAVCPIPPILKTPTTRKHIFSMTFQKLGFPNHPLVSANRWNAGSGAPGFKNSLRPT
jgi:hypothetical protein